MCEPYRGEVEVCDNVLTIGADHVFITKSFGSQKNISEFLQANIPDSLSALADDYCHEQINRTICNYYLMPCGTVVSETPPSSICPEECSLVQTACRLSWDTVQLGLSDYHFIDCNDTSALLFPLTNCCTGVGILQDTESLQKGEKCAFNV